MDLNMIKYAMPFVPLADKTGLNERRYNTPSEYDTQKKFESEYVHPIIGKLEPRLQGGLYFIGDLAKPFRVLSVDKVPMREAYDKITLALGFTHTDITKDPNYINKLNSYRSSPNSQLESIPESLNFSHWPDIPGFNKPMYYPNMNTVFSSPLSVDTMNTLRKGDVELGDVNGLLDYFNNYNYFDQNKYNSTQTSVVAHEAIGHGGNQPKPSLLFYEPIAKRESRPVNEIRTSFEQKFWPTYWNRKNKGSEAEFTLSLHAAKRLGREWGYPVDSDNDEEVVLAFRDTLNKLLKIPIEQARLLPFESQRLRAYLNNTRLYNSYKRLLDDDGLMWRLKQYNDYKSFRSKDQNNPQLMDKTTEDVLYYTTPETLKGLLSRNNNTQLDKHAACKNVNLTKLAKEYLDIKDTNYR